jgi:uncharacterized protein (TIGR03083 family)
MDDQHLQPLISTTCLTLAAVLAELPPSGWDTASLCDGWRVREVVAHVTMPVHYSEAEFMAELQADGFDFTKLSNRLAARDSRRPTDDLVASLRSTQLHEWTPPGGGHRGALNHVVIHSLDVTVPLAVPVAASPDALRAVLDDLTSGGASSHFGTDLGGRRLVASDLEWEFGSGRELRGTASELALHVCGRRLPAGRLEGDPLARVS